MTDKMANILDRPTAGDAAEEINTLASGPGAAHLKKTLGEWMLYRYSESGETRTLDLLVNPSGEATATLTRHADGTAVLTPHRAATLTAMAHIDWWPEELVKALQTHAWDTMLRYLAEHRPSSPTPLADLRNQKLTAKGKDGQPSVSNIIRDTVKDAVARAEINGKVLTDPKETKRRLKTLLSETMTDTAITMKLRQFLPSGGYLQVHNLAVTSREAVTHLLEHRPQILWIHLTYGADADERPRRPFTVNSATESAQSALEAGGRRLATVLEHQRHRQQPDDQRDWPTSGPPSSTPPPPAA